MLLLVVAGPLKYRATKGAARPDRPDEPHALSPVRPARYSWTFSASERGTRLMERVCNAATAR